MTLVEAENALQQRGKELSSDGFASFLKKAKIHYNGEVIHVAGSNGKGETVFYLTRLGLSKTHTGVGSFFNFYYRNFLESIWIDGQPVKEEEACLAFEELLPLAERYGITAFELRFAVALSLFEKKHLPLVILECGMGGENDPTNQVALNKAVCVITNITLEHTEYLGTTQSEIARTVGGIITNETPVVVGNLDEESEEALKLICTKKKTWIRGMERIHLPHLVNREAFVFDYPPFKGITVPGIASYHVYNACLALETAKVVPALQGLTEDQINTSFQEGGFLEGHLDHKGLLYFDPASNPEAIEILRRCFPTLGQKGNVHVLFASLYRQNISAMLPLLDDAAGSVTLTTFDDPNARDEMGYALYTEDHEYIGNPLMALMQLEMRYPGETIVATGCPEFLSYWKKNL